MAIQESNITLDGLVHTLDDRDRVAAQLVNENANTFTGANTFSSTVALNGAVTIGDAALVASGSVSVGSLRTFLASDTTPDVASGSYWLTHASTQTLTHFNGGTVGQLLFVESTAAVTYDVSENVVCGGTDVVTADGDLTAWIYNGTDWLCIGGVMDLDSDFNAVS